MVYIHVWYACILQLDTVAHTHTGQDSETDKKGLEAVEAVLRDARRIAKTLSPAKRAEVEKIISEIEALAKELAELQARGLVS